MDDTIIHKKKEFLNLSLMKDELEAEGVDEKQKVDIVTKMVNERLKLIGNQLTETKIHQPKMLEPSIINA